MKSHKCIKLVDDLLKKRYNQQSVALNNINKRNQRKETNKQKQQHCNQQNKSLRQQILNERL